MPFSNTDERYGWVAQALHWLLALLIISMLILGLVMVRQPLGPDKISLYGWHKSFGAVVLFIAAARLLWRLTQKQPPLPASIAPMQRLAAHGTHFLLYVFMFLMPVSGWFMSAAAGFPVSVFGWFTLPSPIAPDQALRHFFGDMHEIASYALIAALAAHIGAALWHHFILKDTILRRMLPGLALALLPAGLAAAPAGWNIDTEKSSITFTATQNGAPVSGTFTDFSGEIRFDPEALGESYVRITVKTGSVTADYGEVADTLKAADWFDVAQFPEAVYEARDFRKGEDGGYTADGTLTLRGTAVPVTLSFRLEEYGAEKAVAKGTAELKRTAFGVGQGEWSATDAVKDDVTVAFTLHATR